MQLHGEAQPRSQRQGRFKPHRLAIVSVAAHFTSAVERSDARAGSRRDVRIAAEAVSVGSETEHIEVRQHALVSRVSTIAIRSENVVGEEHHVEI